MKRAILTGFEPFGPYKYNPVQDTTREFHGERIGDIEIIGLVLPATYYSASQLLSEKIDELSPDIILGSGLSSSIQRIRVEAGGKNIMNGKYPDAEGKKPIHEPLIKAGKPWYHVTTNPISLARSLTENGISSEVSLDAEGFVCNALMYLTLKKIVEANLPIQFSFFHTPWTTDYLDTIQLEQGKIAITKNDLRKAIRVLLQKR